MDSVYDRLMAAARGAGNPNHSFRGSFSAVSTPILATKYAFFSIFRDLQNDLADFAKFCFLFAKFSEILQKSGNFTEILQNLQKISKILQNFAKFCKISAKICEIL